MAGIFHLRAACSCESKHILHLKALQFLLGLSFSCSWQSQDDLKALQINMFAMFSFYQIQKLVNINIGL